MATSQPLTPRIEYGEWVDVPFVGLVLTWFDVSEFIVGGVQAEWGIRGSSPQDRVAEVGSLKFDVDGAESRPWLLIGTPIRLVINHPLFGDKVVWVGAVKGARPLPGARGRKTSVSCVDWMDEAARAKLTGIPVSTDVQSDEAFQTLAAIVSVQPPYGIQTSAGSDIYPYAFDNTRDESSRVLSEFQKLALSEYGLIWVAAGRLYFEGRRRRAGGGSVKLALDEDENLVAMSVSSDRDDIVNRAQVTVHPRRRDAAATTVLFSLAASLQVVRGTSVVITCQYRDPDQVAQRVGGVDMVTPAAGTDYVFAENEDGTGDDLTAQLTVDADFGGNAAVVTITNAGPYDGYIPAAGLQLRGRGLYDFQPVQADVRDADSAEAYGEAPLAYDMPYQSSPSNALDLASFLVGLNSNPRTRVLSVTVLANWTDAIAGALLDMQVSDRVSITADSIEIDEEPYFVNGFRLDVSQSGVCAYTLILEPVDTSEFWLLEVDGRTELGVTTRLGFGLFVPGWILDTSELGSDTFLN